MKDIAPIDPVTTVRNYREKHVNVRNLLMQGGAPAGVMLKSPKEQRIRRNTRKPSRSRP